MKYVNGGGGGGGRWGGGERDRVGRREMWEEGGVRWGRRGRKWEGDGGGGGRRREMVD